MTYCLICDDEASVSSISGYSFDTVNCANCGKYILTEEALRYLDEDKKRYLSILLRERFLKGLNPIAIYRDHPVINNDQIHWPIFTVDELSESYPTKISERLDRTLANLTALSEYPGATVQIQNNKYASFFTLSNSVREVMFMMQQLYEEGLISGSPNTIPTELTVTVKGWNRVALLENYNSPNNTDVFVAMWFNSETESPYENGIRKAIEAAGYNPVRIDKVEHNNKIDDEIIAAIKKCKFVISDFTGHRGGVYFEAGFAMGLGKPVIWTCREDELKNIHFDTRQYSHIVWQDENDLYEKLLNRIRATIN